MKKRCLFAVVLTLMLTLLQAAQAADTGMGQTIDDSAITAQVKGKMMADKNLDASDINVDTEDGRVVLSGRVETGAEKARAAEIARSVDGVTQVENDLSSPACPIGANWRC